MYSLSFSIHSEVGRIRKNNQDAGYASPNLLVVTDGMGGAAAGDLASAVASLEASRSDVRPADSEEALERIAGMVARANAKLTELIDEDLELDGMGTTFCGVMFDGTQFALAHVGDSRGYRLRDGELVQLTHDHSWVQSLIDEGKITPAQAAVHPHRSLILKVLNGQVTFEPDFEILDAQLGDRLMFCSDGLSGLVEDDEILELLAEDSIEDAIERLARAANDNGGHDNITIVIADVVEQDDELDARAGVLVGSATEVEVPRTGQLAQEKGGHDKEAPYPPAPSPASSPYHDDDEVARYSPQEPGRRWPGIVGLILAVAVVLGGSAWGVWAYSESRYYVSADAGDVAIFNGLPGNVPLLPASLIERTDIRTDDLPPYHQDKVAGAITSGSIEQARGTVEALRVISEDCIAARERRLNPPAKPTPSPTASPSPTPSIPGLPFATERPTSTRSATVSPGPAGTPRATYLFPSELGTVAPDDVAEADPGEC